MPPAVERSKPNTGPDGLGQVGHLLTAGWVTPGNTCYLGSLALHNNVLGNTCHREAWAAILH